MAEGRTWRTKHLAWVAAGSLFLGVALGAAGANGGGSTTPSTQARSEVAIGQTTSTATPTSTAAPATITTVATTTTTRPGPTTTSSPTTVAPAQRKMPAVTGERLDVAKAHLRDAGYPDSDVEVIGGGTFGPIDQANWTVCSTEPGAGVVAAKARLVIARFC